MAPVIASTPISRRNRRRRQRQQRHAQRKRTPNIDQALPDCTSGSPGQSGTDVTTSRSNLSYFAPDIYSAGQYGSNPYDFLDVPIPSPTVSISLPVDKCQDTRSTTQHYCSGAIEVCSDPLLLPQEDTKTRSGGSALQQSIFADESPLPSLPAESEGYNTQEVHNDVACDHGTNIIRIPSPLMYHKRSGGGCSEPLDVQSEHVIPSSSNSNKHDTNHDRLMSEIRAAGYHKLPSATPPILKSRTSATNLPLMNDHRSVPSSGNQQCVVEQDEVLYAFEDSVPSMLPVVTTNTYIFPKRLYRVYCQPQAAWSGPTYNNICGPWESNGNFVFPKLTISMSEVLPQADNGPPFLAQPVAGLPRQRSQRMTKDNEFDRSSLPFQIVQILESRSRSSTGDSFNSKFNVNTATKIDDTLPASTNIPSSSKVDEATRTPRTGELSDLFVCASDESAIKVSSEEMVHIGASEDNNVFKENTGLNSESSLHPTDTAIEEPESVWFDYTAPHLQMNGDIVKETTAVVDRAEFDQDERIPDADDGWTMT